MKQKIKVLMVDDEPQFRATTEKVLRRKGFDTVLAASGEEALGKLSEKPDVVILDIRMEGMDGHEALREIRKRAPGLPVIMLTGHGALPSAMESRTEGAFDYLTKPCDVDLLAAKIKDAAKYGLTEEPVSEKRVGQVMVPIEDYTTLNAGRTVRDALRELKKSFTSKVSTGRLMETGHRSILVISGENEIQGILSIRDLLEMVMPSYLSAPKPSTADSIQYSPLFWSGMFAQAVDEKASMEIGRVMSPAPPTLDDRAHLMEAAYMMVTGNLRRLVVTRSGRVVGVIREQELFFEMEEILNRSPTASQH